MRSLAAARPVHRQRAARVSWVQYLKALALEERLLKNPWFEGTGATLAEVDAGLRAATLVLEMTTEAVEVAYMRRRIDELLDRRNALV